MKRRFSSQFLGMNSAVIYNNRAGLLIDPGVFPPEIDRISDFLKNNELNQLSVALTHTHGDHIAGWHAFGQYDTYTHSIIGQKSQTVRDNDLRYLEGMYRKQGYEIPKNLKFPQSLIYMDDGEFVRIQPVEFCFYHTPGHSMDMSVIIIPDERVILSGDMLILTPLPFILHSIQQYWQSLKKIRDLITEYNLQHLIPGHGKPADSQKEILSRIENEQQYVHKLVTRGKGCLESGKNEKELKSVLHNCFPELSSLHAHQSNIQTFIREKDDLKLEMFE